MKTIRIIFSLIFMMSIASSHSSEVDKAKYITPELLGKFHAEDLSKNTDQYVLRLTILRSLDAPIMITWRTDFSKPSVFNVKMLSKGENAKLIYDKKIALGDAESNAVCSMFKPRDLDDLKEEDWGNDSSDGSVWVWEYVTAGKYKKIIRSNPLDAGNPNPDGRPKGEELRQVRSLIDLTLMIWLRCGLEKERIY